MFAQPEFWVAVAFVILMGVFAYFGVHRTVLKTLDHRSDRIKAELDDARHLKEEAGKLLAEYKARHASAEREAEDIIASAKAEAERIASEAKAKMEDFVVRRTKTAESKIALAEAQALADVRAAAADAAVAAASTILSQSVKGEMADELLAKGIAEVRGDQGKRDVAVLRHRYRRPVDLGGDRLLLHAALHHRDAKRDFDRGRRARRAGDDAALNADPCGDLVAVLRAIAGGSRDGGLNPQIVADRLLARRGHRIGRRAGANADRRTGQVSLAFGSRLGGLFRPYAKKTLEAIAKRLRGRRRGKHAETCCECDRGQNRDPTPAKPGGPHDHMLVTHSTSLASPSDPHPLGAAL